MVTGTQEGVGAVNVGAKVTRPKKVPRVASVWPILGAVAQE